jgi:hypothetical protein
MLDRIVEQPPRALRGRGGADQREPWTRPRPPFFERKKGLTMSPTAKQRGNRPTHVGAGQALPAPPFRPRPSPHLATVHWVALCVVGRSLFVGPLPVPWLPAAAARSTQNIPPLPLPPWSPCA